MDLKKAFDTVDHAILLRKLEKYGFRGTPLKWVENYLNERTQCVKILNCESSFVNIVCGVPQGSVLGPLFFLLYVNDIDNVCTDLYSVLFADDTNLFISGKEIEPLYSSMNTALGKIVTWLQSNKLSLNVLKTHYMLFTLKKNKDISNLTLKLNGLNINRVEKTKFLGVIVDDKLNWNCHIEYIKKKVSKNAGIICKARNYFERSTLTTLYYTFIFPYLIYCIEVWGSASLVHINKLLKVQKRLCRVIASCEHRTPSMPLFKSLRILTIYDVHSFSVAVFMHRFSTNMLPNIFNSFFQLNSDNSFIITRQNNDLRLPFFRLSISQKTMKYKGVVLWNNLPNFITSVPSVSLFKKKLKCFYLDKY